MEKRTGMGDYYPTNPMPIGGTGRGGLPDISEFIQLGIDNGSADSNRRSRRSFVRYNPDEDRNSERTLPIWYHIGIAIISLGLVLALLILMTLGR